MVSTKPHTILPKVTFTVNVLNLANNDNFFENVKHALD